MDYTHTLFYFDPTFERFYLQLLYASMSECYHFTLFINCTNSIKPLKLIYS